MEPFSIEGLRRHMMIQRDKRVQTAVRNIYDEIQKAADQELSELIVRIVPKEYWHVMLNTIRLDKDIADEVMAQLQPLLGDIRSTKIEQTIHFEW